MYKPIIFVLLSLASLGAAIEDEREYGLLMGREKLFKDFCLQSRDSVIEDLKTLAHEKSSLLFRQFFNTANEITDEILNAEKHAVQELAAQIENPEKPISNELIDEDEIARMIAKGKREIQEKAGALGVTSAMQVAGQVFLSAASSALFIRLAKARSAMDGFTLRQGILDQCSIAHGLEDKLAAQMEDYKAKLLAAHQDPSTQKFIHKINLKTMRCFTSKNVVHLSYFCDLVNNGFKPFKKMLGLGDEVE